MEHVISMEELLSRKVNVVRTEAGETSRNSNQPVTFVEETQRVSIEFNEEASTCTGLKAELFKKLDVLRDKEELRANMQNQAEPTKPKIQKVPFFLREKENFKKYYEPRAVSFGPIHHGEKYQPAEKWKLRLAYDFIKNSGEDKTVLYQKVADNIDKLKECFEEEMTKKFNDEALALMLFVDGCAILQFIYNTQNTPFYLVAQTSKDKKDQVAFGQRDLFLLENQVPYQLLEDLMLLSLEKDELMKAIKGFIHETGGNEGNPNEETKPNEMGTNKTKTKKEGTNETKPIHLLDLLRTSLLGNYPEVPTGSSSRIHLLDLLRTSLLGNDPDVPTGSSSQKKPKPIHSYRHVQELRAAGIHFRCNEKSGLKEISFTKRCNFFPGYLNLPRITVDDFTAPKFLNLIAYEMCPDFDNDFGIISYISFLDSLIDKREDVIELRKAHILENCLGSDKEVAKLFNEISTDLVPNPKAYRKVKEEIQKYYDNQLVTWISEAWHNHFDSPWTFLAFFGALLALALSAGNVTVTCKNCTLPLRASYFVIYLI